MSELQGLIVAAHGRHYLAHADGKFLQCVTRGKKSDVATGDRVRLTATSPDQAVIDEILPRDTLLYRSDQYKSKLLASNVTQLFIVVATEPGFSDDLISRSLVAANAAGITARLILNKTDIAPLLPVARDRLALYQRLGYAIHEVSAKADPTGTLAMLQPLMSGQSTILIGQSGMGKSSLVNLLVPDADIAVREISQRLDTGKHTTTFTRLYALDEQSSVIDSPGFQEFGLYHLSEGMLERAFPEFAPHLGLCRFYNCHHQEEPGCAILAALASGQITESR
ncbi:MAG: ribosome small subunit-dependent GTPase A, partial [Betaproteobacteria bacterium]|nr:ribosome small subunit-dependent GTPase A [Betaproteobacteria bacterium]